MMGWAGISPSIPQRLARGPLRTGDQLYFPVSVLVYLATPTSILLTRMPLGGWPCQTSTLQPLHRNGVLWGDLGLWDPCSHLLVSLPTQAQLSRAWLVASQLSVLSPPFPLRGQPPAVGPWFLPPPPASLWGGWGGRLPGPHSHTIPCMAKWLSGCGRSQVCHAGLGEIPKAILGFGVATLSLQPSEMELATRGVCWRTCYLAFHPRQGESCLEPWAPGRMSSGSLGPAAALIVGSCRACFLS